MLVIDRMYLKDIGKIPLLSIDEETELAKLVVDGREAKRKVDEIESDDQNTVSVEEFEALMDLVDQAHDAKDKLVNANLRLVVSIAKRYLGRGLQFLDLIQEGNMGLIKAVDKFDHQKGFKFSTYATWWIRQAITRAVADQARTIRIPVHMVETINKLVEANLRLVVSIAKKYVGRGLQFLDLIQEGNMGLMKAVEKFDSARGFKFSTYATWWIRQAITRAVADQARTIRIPVHMVETINKLVRVQRQLVQELSREPSPEEVADRMGIPVEKVQQIQKIAQEPISLEAPVG